MPRPKINNNIPSYIEELIEEVKNLRESVVAQNNVMEIRELKGKIGVLGERVNDQKKLIDVSKDNINNLKEIITNQNKIIVGLVSELKVMLKSIVIPGQASTKYDDMFPIESENELKEIEDEINEETNYAMVATIKNILKPGGLNKNLVNILDKKMLFDFNVTGKQEKKRLLDYPKFVDAMYKAHSCDGSSKKMFLEDLKKAFRLTKNRFYKNKSIKKKRIANKKFFDSDTDESDEENIEPLKS